WRNAETFEQARNELGLRATVVDQRAAAARKQDADIWVAACQFGHDSQPLGRLVEHYLVARARAIDRPAKDNDPVRRPARRIPGREAVLQRNDQRIAEG